MPRRGLLSGDKINGNHSTVIPAAEIVIETAKKHDEVTKITVGIIKQIGSGPRRLKCRPVFAGLEVKVRGSDAVQTLYVYTKNQEGVIEALEDAWEYAVT